MKSLKHFPNIILIIRIFLLSLSVFFCFRLILFLTETDRVGGLSENFVTILLAFIMGIRFDLVISGYILFFPFIIISLLSIINKPSKITNRVLFYLIYFLFCISFAMCAIDIPYFNQFFTRLNVTALAWLDSPAFVFKMIVEEPRLWLFVLPAILLSIVFYKALKRIFTSFEKHENTRSRYLVKSLIFVLFLGLIFVGVRGRISKKSPIRIGTAYFSDNSFLNQLGLNPVFTFLRSYIDSKDERNNAIQLMDEKTAIANVQKYLSISPGNLASPLYRKIDPDTIAATKHNVVVVIMESMSAAKMKRFDNKKNLTPFLDSLAVHSYCFDHIYTAGMHTFNGIFSTLFSFPAIFRQHPMKDDNISNRNGMASVLRQQGYTTTYFTTHDGQFDNVEGFLRSNDFENVISQSDYPFGEIKTTLGVPDDYLFRYSIPYISKLNDRKKPFFVAFMTASDHAPFYVPDYFKSHFTTITDQITEYADWSIRQFISMASKQSWFRNTLFVFIADHGAPINTTYDISLDYHHTPLIFYAPYLLPENQAFEMIGGQIDVFPTIMGLIKLPYVNTTLGVDLLKQSRPYIFINSDDKYGVLNKEFFLIVRKDGRSNLYRYLNNDKTDYLSMYEKEANLMNEYAKSNLQVFQYILKQRKPE